MAVLVRRICIVMVMILCGDSVSHAQDVIILNNGDRLEGRVMAIEGEHITYVAKGDTSSQMIILNAREVRGIRYSDNTTQLLAAETGTATFTADDYRLFAVEDANRMYRVRRSAPESIKWTTWILTPFIGWIPAMPVSAARPDRDFLRFPDPALESVPAYKKEYKKQAHRLKSREVWTAYFQATGDWFSFFPRMVFSSESSGSRETVGKPPKNQPDRKNDPKPVETPKKDKAEPVTAPQD
jgi:hypothetical protein